jgi:hypothetical protein
MPVSPRDYKAEYRRRIERALNSGLSRAQGRGHPGAGEPYIRPRKQPRRQLFDGKLEKALKELRKGGATLSGVARNASVSRERLSRYIKSVAGARREGRRWLFDDKRVRRMEIITTEQWRPVKLRVRGFEPASRAGSHAQEAAQALLDQRLGPEFIRKWEGQGIEDVRGRWYTLSTDLNQIYSAVLMNDYSFENYYRIET